jgi:hypothetical protein
MRVVDFVAFVYGPADRGPSPCRHHYFPKRVLKLDGDTTVMQVFGGQSEEMTNPLYGFTPTSLRRR